MVSAARLIRRFHDATAGTPPAADAEVVCHGDLGQHNIVFRGDEAVAIIDWDEDEDEAPGARLLDVAPRDGTTANATAFARCVGSH